MVTPRVTIDELPEQVTVLDEHQFVIQDAGITKRASIASLKMLLAEDEVLIEDPPGSGLYYGGVPEEMVIAGLPVGGTAGQVLTKDTGDDYDTSWDDPIGGGFTVEEAVDAVAAALTEGVGIDLVYDDGANTITVGVDTTELSLTKADVGLSNVDNTTDLTKPVSTATQTALNLKASTTDLSTHAADTSSVHGIADTSVLATTTDLATHAADTTAVHGITDTSVLVTQTALDLKGDKHQTVNAQTGTTYTLVLGDDAKFVTLTNASAITLTVPLNSSVAFPTGTRVDLAQLGAGQVTVAATGGVTLNGTPGLKCRAQYSAASLVKYATDSWLLVGDLSA